MSLHLLWYILKWQPQHIAQSAGAVEYTHYTSAEG